MGSGLSALVMSMMGDTRTFSMSERPSFSLVQILVQAIQRGLHPYVCRPVLQKRFIDVEGFAQLFVQPIPLTPVGDIQPVACISFQAVIIVFKALAG